MTGLTSDDIRALSSVFASAGWSSLRLCIGGDILELSVDSSHMGSAAGTLATNAPAVEAAPQTPAPPASPSGQDRAGDAPQSPAADSSSGTRETITAPNLGTFYAAPAPGEAPYIEVGQLIEAGDEVALLEVMKLYTPVRSQVSGTVVEVVASDGQLVEFGEPLIVVDTGTG